MGTFIKAKPIAAHPWIVQTIDPAVDAYLQGLPAPDFTTVSDVKAEWARTADEADEGSIVVGGGGGSARTYVVSREAHLRARTHRF